MLRFYAMYGQSRGFKRGRLWWVAYFDGQGHEWRESSHSPDKSVARQLLRQRLATSSRPQAVHNFEHMAALYVQDHALKGQRSREWAEDRVNNLATVFAGQRIDRMTPQDMQRFREGRLALGAAAATVNKDLGALGRMFTLAIREGWIQHKPSLERLQEADPRQGFVEHQQYLAIREHLPAPYQDALDFGYYSGWRKGEITGLTWAMVDLASGIVRLPPSGNETRQGRVLIVSEPLRQVIERRLQQRLAHLALVFHDKGRAIRNWRKAWRSATIAAGCPWVLLHDIRRTMVRNLMRAGVPERMAMAVTGHKARDVFDRYNSITEREVALAATQLAHYLAGDSQSNTDKTRTNRHGLAADKPLVNGRGVAQPGIAHLPWAQGVGGSNPLAPTIRRTSARSSIG